MWWVALIVLYLAYQVIGGYVSYYAVKNGYVRMMSTYEWAFAVSSWPWLLRHIRKVSKNRDRMRPFEDFFDRHDQEQIDKRLDDLGEENAPR